MSHLLKRYRILHKNVQKLFIHTEIGQRDDHTINEEIILDIYFSLMLKAIRSKMDSTIVNHIYVLVNLPMGMLPNGS